MANLNVNPEYDIDMEQLTPETRAHADRFNERYGQLLGNDAFLKGKLEEANTSIERAMAVAQGKSAGLVFNTYAELIAYIAVPANAEKFRLGDQFLIKAMDVPDYWWDNTVTTEQTDIEGNVISAKNSSGKVIGALVELEARKVDLSKYDENDAALFDNMSDQYSASRTYDVGDICIYDNNLYKCVTAVETAETFDQAKWNKTSFAALHADQEKKISENTQSLTNKLDASNVDTMFCESIPGRNQITNFLHVDLNNRNSDINKIHYFGSNNPATTFVNSPYTAGPFFGYRVVRWCSGSANAYHLVTVELHEQYPVSGRVWSNTYDINTGTWYGWKCNQGNTFIDVGTILKSSTTIAAGATVTYVATRDCFVNVSTYAHGSGQNTKIYINNICIFNPYNNNGSNAGLMIVQKTVPLKTGQTIKIENGTYTTSDYAIFAAF